MVGPPASLPIALVFRVENNAYNEGEDWLRSTTERIMVNTMNEMTKFEKGTLAMNATKELAELGVIRTRDYVHLLENILEEVGVKFDKNELEETMNRKGWE